MAARIRSTILASDVDEASRNDAVVGSIVSLVSMDAATTYAWAIAFAPEGSTATFTGSSSAITPGTFTTDLEGAYLIRLIIDATLASEDVQYVRVRVLTLFGGLTLVAAGERRDGTGTIPVDVDVEGWANEQNSNITTLLAFLKPLVSSGRVLYVDANDGTSNYADHDTVQAAINDAVSNTPSSSEQWVVLVRPGRYVENLTFAEYVHVFGWPGNPDGKTSEAVVLEGVHTAAPGAASRLLLSNLHIENNTNSASATITKTGAGALRLFGCRVESNGTLAAQGAAVEVTAGAFDAIRSRLIHTISGAATRFALLQNGPSTIDVSESTIWGPNGAVLNSASNPSGVSATFTNCRILASAGAEITTLANLTSLDHCYLAGTGVYVNPGASGIVGDVRLDMLFCNMVSGDISFDTTGITGSTTLNLGSIINPSVNILFPGGAVDFDVAQTVSRTHWYDNTASGLLASNVQDAIDEVAASAPVALAPVVYHKNIPEIPNDTVRYRGWSPVATQLIAVRVYMETPNTVGTYQLAVTNNATGNTVLAVASTPLNGIVAATPTPVALTGTPADLIFATLDRWTIALTSDDLGFDGEAIYVELVFNPASASGPVVEDLATTLLVGNITGGTDIELTTGDEIVGQTAVVLRATGAASDIELFPGASGAVIVNGKLTVTGIIDPTGIIFTQESIATIGPLMGGSEGAIYVSDGGGGIQADTPVFVGASALSVLPLFGGLVVDTTYGAGPVVNLSLPRGIGLYTPSLSGSRVVQPRLPAASISAGHTVYVEHRGDGSGTLTMMPTGLDTIAGGATSAVTPATVAAYMSDGVSDWRLIELGGGAGVVAVQENVPPLPNATFRYEGWAAVDGAVAAIRVLMATKHTVGSYTAIFTNEATGNTMLVGASYAMAGVTSGVVESLILTGTAGDLLFSAGDKWSVEFVSDNAGFDGDGIYFDIVWGTSSTSFTLPGAPDDDHQIEMAVSPGNTVNTLFFAPYALTLVGVRVYCESGAVSAGGVYTLAVEDIDNANNLLGAATFDMETPNLPAATLTTVPLTGTTVDLDLAVGTQVRIRLVSDNGDLAAAGVFVQLLYRSQ